MTGNNHDIQRDDRRCGTANASRGSAPYGATTATDGYAGTARGRKPSNAGAATLYATTARAHATNAVRGCAGTAHTAASTASTACARTAGTGAACATTACARTARNTASSATNATAPTATNGTPARTRRTLLPGPVRGRPVREPFTFGLEIEVDGNHDTDMLRNHRLIAGWCPDGSLHHDGSLEYQSEPMTMSQLTEIRRLVERIATDTDNTLSGGHMHISRTGRQTPARWYWALEALDETQCEALNMRHMTDTRWCELIHGDYCGKDTAINDTHRHTIEFRTFGPWHHDTAGRLDAAVHYMHAMWRFFQKFPVPKLKTRDIQAMSRVAATQAINDTNATTAGRRRI